MATEQAAEDPDVTPLTAAERPAATRDDVAELLETVRSTLQTAVLADVMTLIAETDAPEQSELQRRARAVQVELTLRRQEVALDEWRRKLAAAGQEAERQRQLFARLEADFARRSADFARRSADFAQRSADFEARSADFEARSADFEARSADFEARSADFEARSADFERLSKDFALRSVDFEQQSAEFERAATIARETQKALTEAHELRAAQLTRELAAASELNQARQQMIQTLEQDLARARQEKSELDENLARRETVLTEAERRVEELRNSRWRQIGIGFGLAKRATFEK